ncbi:MAG: PilZ domain-containing protein [Thermoanaerobaculia bacterium]
MPHNLKVLAVVNADVVSKSLAEVFCRDSIALHHAQSGAAALILTGNSLYDLLVIEEPLADLSVESLAASLQSLEWASAGAPALILTGDAKVETMAKSLATYPVRVVAASASKSEIQHAVAELLGVPVRSSSRMMVNVEVATGSATQLRCFQSENVSESGLLLKGAQAIPVGTRVDIVFSLPDESEPVRGTALVVRHTGNGEAPGVGLRFVELEPDELLRLRRFVDRNLPRTPEVASSSDDTEQRASA